MANNRLYLFDPEDGEAFLLCKTSGDGWIPYAPGPLVQSYEERDAHNPLAFRLMNWLRLRDMDASYGNCLNVQTGLVLCTEADLPCLRAESAGRR